MENNFFKFNDSIKKDVNLQNEIIKKFTPLIKSSIKKYFRNNDNFEDAFQDGILEILKLIKIFNSNTNISFECFLKYRLKFFYMQKYFKQKNILEKTFSNTYIFKDEQELDVIENIVDENIDVEKEILDLEMKEDVKKAISFLSKRQKEVIYFRFFKNLKYKEISKIMNITEDTAKEHYKIAKKKMKKYFCKNYNL